MTQTLVISQVFPPQIGGNGHWMWQLYSRLPRDQFMIAADMSTGSEAFDQTHKLRVIRTPLQLDSWGAFGWQRGAAYYRIYSKLNRIVREFSIDFIHASNSLPEGFLAWMLHRRLGLPYLVYAHGEELNVATKSRELSWMTRWIYREADLIVANSHNTARLLHENWNVSPGRVRVMHPGVNTDRFRPVPRNEEARVHLGWGNRPVILTVGRLIQRKGQEDLIRALPAIRRHLPNVLLAVAGAGPCRERLDQVVAELALGDYVKMHGELQEDDLVTAFQQCDVFAMPNKKVAGEFEGFGIVFLEAQACGKPAVAGDSGGTAEAILVPESGCMVGQNCPDELSRTLVELLLDERQRTQMGQAGRQWVAENFNWDSLASQAMQIFHEHFESHASCRQSDDMPAEPSLP